MTSDLSKKATWVVTVGSDYNIYYNNNNNGVIDASSAWKPWGGLTRYEPFTLHIWDGYIDVFVIDALTSNLKMKTCSISSPVNATDGWYNLGGNCAGAPVAVCYNVSSKRNAVYVVGFDGNIYECDYSGSWNWSKLPVAPDGRTPAFQPDKIYASTNGTGRIDIVAVAVTNDLYHRYWQGSWSAWVAVGNNAVGSRPICTTLADNRCDIVVKSATDHKLYYTAVESGRWFGWAKVSDTPVIFNPHGTVTTPNTFEFAAIGLKGNLLTSYFTVKAGSIGSLRSDYNDHGGVFSSSPIVSSRNNKTMDVFGRGMNGSVYAIIFDGSWGGYSRLGTQVTMEKPA